MNIRFNRAIALSLLVGLVLFIILTNVSRASAQDITPIARDTIPTWVDFLDNSAGVFATLTLVFGPVSSLLVTVIKVVIVRLKPAWSDAVAPIAFFMPLVFAGLYWTVDYFGFGDTFIKATNITLLIAPVVLSYLGVAIGQALTYQGLKKLKTPGSASTSLMLAKG